MSVRIASIGVHIPERRITNEELATMIDTTDEWIRSHTGIGNRHVAADGSRTSDLAADAARSALSRAGIGAAELDLILVATATPDYFGFPSTACVVQDKIGAIGCTAFDISAGCTGFIYALEIASSILEAKRARHALVIGAETLTRVTNWADRSTCVLLGDGAGAAVLSRTDEAGRGILDTALGADGSGAEDLRLVQPARATTFMPDAAMVPYLEMNGKRVYDFAVKSIVSLVERLLAKGSYTLDDFEWVVPHQANARIVQAAAKRLGLPVSRFYMNMEEYANTSSASVPIALEEMDRKGLLKEGKLAMLLGFGSGLTYGGAVVRW
jgi:3-oxoacyl-[acyl-carrier-protein] synthase-3